MTDHNSGGMNWTKQNLNPFNKGCSQSVNQNPPAPAHKDIHPLTRQEVMTTVCKLGKFNSIQFFFLFDSPCKEYFLSFECVYVSEIAWHLLSVPYIQNNLHKRTIVILIGLDWCRGGEKGGEQGRGDGERVKRHGQLCFGVQEVRGGAGCQDRGKRAEVQERG